MPSKAPKPKSAATRELTDILAWRVDVVDRAANAREFLVVKNEGGEAAGTSGDAAPAEGGAPPAEPNPASTEKALPPMHPATRQRVLDAAASSLEKIAAVASVIAEATTDEGAADALPGEVLRQLEASFAELDALVDTYEEPTEQSAEMAAKVEKAAGMSHDTLREALCGQLRAQFPTADVWVYDVDDQFVVFRMGSKLYRHGYAVAGAEVSLGGTLEEVMVAYVPVAQAAATTTTEATEAAPAPVAQSAAVVEQLDIAKRLDELQKSLAELSGRMGDALTARLEKSEAELASMRARVAATEGRLAIGKSVGGGNAHVEAPPPAEKPAFRWPRDLSEEVSRAQSKSGA